MAYERYKTIMSEKEFFDIYVGVLPNYLKDIVYRNYVEKCKTLQRDNFTCQVSKCSKKLDLTVHHFKAQRNGGRSVVRNLVTVCQGCHNKHNRGDPVTFKNSSKLPANIAGVTQQSHFGIQKERGEIINWKEIRVAARKLRRLHKDEYGRKNPTPWEVICLLMRWLDTHYEEIKMG